MFDVAKGNNDRKLIELRSTIKPVMQWPLLLTVIQIQANYHCANVGAIWQEHVTVRPLNVNDHF